MEALIAQFLPVILKMLGNMLLQQGASKPIVAADGDEPILTARWLQKSLVKLGHQVEITGKNDEQTRAAVEVFQKKHGLVVDGWAGTKTNAVIFAQLDKLGA